MSLQTPQPGVDLREALYNDRRVGPAGQIQLPHEAVTRLHGLMVDLDADLLRPNPWFPPADAAEDFFAGIAAVLERHPILQHAEVRHTGRWLHALAWFRDAVELRSGADQQRWAALHRVLIGSVPSDPAAPVLIGLTRPVGSVNGKTGRQVKTLKQGTPVPADRLEAWARDVAARPFETIGSVLFGERRVTPCPYCGGDGSHLDLGEVVGFCYGRCRQVPVGRLFEPFVKAAPAPASRTRTDRKGAPKGGSGPGLVATNEGTQLIEVDGDLVLQIDPSRVRSITIRLGKP
jgi:hypothetical protein